MKSGVHIGVYTECNSYILDYFFTQYTHFKIKLIQ